MRRAKTALAWGKTGKGGQAKASKAGQGAHGRGRLLVLDLASVQFQNPGSRCWWVVVVRGSKPGHRHKHKKDRSAQLSPICRPVSSRLVSAGPRRLSAGGADTDAADALPVLGPVEINHHLPSRPPLTIGARDLVPSSKSRRCSTTPGPCEWPPSRSVVPGLPGLPQLPFPGAPTPARWLALDRLGPRLAVGRPALQLAPGAQPGGGSWRSVVCSS